MSNGEAMGSMVEPKEASTLQKIRSKTIEVNDRLTAILGLAGKILEVIVGPGPGNVSKDKATKQLGLLGETEDMLNDNIEDLKLLESLVSKIKKELV